MRRYFKKAGSYFDGSPNYLGEILEDDGSLIDIEGDGNRNINTYFGKATVERYVNCGALKEITKEEAALLFGFV